MRSIGIDGRGRRGEKAWQAPSSLSPLLAFVGILSTAFALLFCLDIPRHNRRLDRLEQLVQQDVLHPTGSRLILRRSVVENLNGTGDGCDFAVIELRQGGGSPELLRQFYASLQLKDPDTGTPLSLQVHTAPLAPESQIGIRDPITRLTTAEERKTADYAITIAAWSEPGCDYRCE